MKHSISRAFFTGALGIAACAANAQTSTPLNLPALFSDHMVLQQKTDAPVWGRGDASRTVCVVGSWNPADTASATVDDYGHWAVNLPTPSYGGPYSLEVFYRGLPADTLTVRDVMIGEVWLCSGQSNMEWSPANGIENYEQERAGASNPAIRFFSLAKTASETPQDNCIAKWEVCTPDVMSRRSAVAYMFGRNLNKKLDGVPVGLIVSAWGGTPAEVWVPEDSVNNNSDIAEAVIETRYPWWPVQPGVLYNSMIHPLAPYGIAGAIWYQGESNRDNPQSYRHLMSTLIRSWRKDFRKEFPFFIVQIAPFNYASSNNGPALVREAQQQVADKVPSVGLIPTIDIGNVNNIHPAKKSQVGERLANMALGRVYGRITDGFEAPRAIDAVPQKSALCIQFSNAGEGMSASSKEIKGLSVAGTDGVFHPAKGTLKNNVLTVKSSEVKSPVKVRYCFDDASEGTVFNSFGLPLLPFSLSVEP